MKSELEAPTDGGETRDVAVVKALLGFIPVVGSALAEFAGVHGNNYGRRVEAWMGDVTAVVNHLQRHASVNLEDLLKNQAFHSFLLQATPIAIRNHRRVKLDALQSALAAVGVDDAFSGQEDMAFQFLRYIDELTVTHISLLKAVANRHEVFALIHTMTLAHEALAVGAMQGLRPDEIRVFLRDLDARGLIRANDLEDLPEYESKAVYIAAENSERHPLLITELGRQFIRFITDHKVDQQRDADVDVAGRQH
jgi:hypothetical protein